MKGRIIALAVLVTLTVLWPRPGPAAAAGTNTINSLDAEGDTGFFTSLALDSSGIPVMSYHDVTNGDLKVLRCGNSLCTAGNTIATPDTAGVVGKWTSLALDASGNPVVSYLYESGQDLRVLHCGNPACTSGNTITSPDTVGVVGAMTSLALDTSGNPVVSYEDNSNHDLRVLHCGNPTCTSGNAVVRADESGSTGIRSSLVLDANGNPVVTYAGTELRIIHCGNPNCTSGNTITAPGTSSSAFPGSIALDASGNPVVSYWDSGLKVLHCGNPNCTSGNSITSPDTDGAVGIDSSLALDASGFPVVSYHDATNNTPRLLHCNDPNCAGGDESIAVVDPGGGGSFTSLALDASGNPVFSYKGAASQDLRSAHCGDPNCSGVKPPLQGDVNCDSVVDVIDALFVLQKELGLRVDSGSCPLPPAPPDTLYAAGGDVDKNGVTNVVDALFILQCEVGVKPGASMAFCASTP